MLSDVTVLVITYKPNYNKLFLTLKSIIVQKDIKFDIVIADDGSPDFDNDAINKWFDAHSFSDYQIIALAENAGTVKNIENGLKSCSGKYLKLISPGDLIYNEFTLKKFFDFCESNNYEVAFGNSIYYTYIEEKISVYPKLHYPNILKPYRKNNFKKAKFNFLVFGDFILAPSYFVNTSLFNKYYLQIADKVKFAEDTMYILMIADGVEPHYLNSPIVWYEYGTGISTSNNSKWISLIVKDLLSVGEMIREINPEYKIFNEMNLKKKTPKIFLLRLRRKLSFKFAKLFTKVDFSTDSLNNLLTENTLYENKDI